MTARCECCDLPVASCGKAAETKQRAERAAEVRSLKAWGFHPADYPGACGHCGVPFPPGTLIRHFHGHGWVAECCCLLVGELL
jgi:hypothetical protein